MPVGYGAHFPCLIGFFSRSHSLRFDVGIVSGGLSHLLFSLVFHFSPTTVSHTIRHKNHNRQLGLEFTFPSSQTASQDIMQATLNLFLLNGQRLKQFKNVEFIDIEISVQMANASSQEVYEKHRLIPVERQENVEGKNFPINITKLVKAWYNSKEEKHKIFFSVSNSMTSEKLPIRIIASDLNNLATVSKNVWLGVNVVGISLSLAAVLFDFNCQHRNPPHSPTLSLCCPSLHSVIRLRDSANIYIRSEQSHLHTCKRAYRNTM